MKPYLLVVRPHHWLKNGLVFVPLFFAGTLFSSARFFEATAAFAAFCLVASAMYIVNDLRDRAQDALHPKKRFRPIAAGHITSTQAGALAGALIGTSLALCLIAIPAMLAPLFVYVALNIAYSLWFKHVPVIDILLVAGFYLLRVVAGGAATDTQLSSWLILATIFLSLFIVVGKRRAEFRHEARRPVLARYSKELLDHLLTLSAGLAITVYALYSVLVLTMPLAVYTVIPVVAGVAWFLYRVYTTHDAEYPEKLLFKDPMLFFIFSLWGFSLLYLLYV